MQRSLRIKKLLVANRCVRSRNSSSHCGCGWSLKQIRGEIAVRILNAARELDIETYAVFTKDDLSHTYNTTHCIQLPSSDSYNDASQLIQIVNDNAIDAIHPGYGFLSESTNLAKRVNDETGAIVIGPGASVLDQTADKLQARKLAESCTHTHRDIRCRH